MTSVSMISFSGRDGEYVPFDSITPEQKAMFNREVGKRVSPIASQMFERIALERGKKANET